MVGLGVFEQYPLHKYKELKNTNYFYDVDNDIVVSHSEIMNAKLVINNDLRIVGQKNTMNRIYKSYFNLAPPNPEWKVYQLLEQSFYSCEQTTKEIDSELLKLIKGSDVFKYIGPSMGGISLHNIKTDVLSSALHKYIRRGYYEKAIWCMVEREMFNVYNDIHSQKYKAFSTRMFNRLGPIISCEDIGLGNVFLPVYIESMKKKLNDSNTTSSKRRYLYFILTHNMIRSKKSRESSHLRAVYNAYQSRNQRIMDKFKKLFQFIEHNSPHNSVDDFIRMFDLGSELCLLSYFSVLYNDQMAKKDINKKLLAMMDYASEHTNQKTNKYKDVFSILRSWFVEYKFEERFLFGTQTVLIALKFPPKIELEIPTIETCNFYWMRNIESGGIVIDDYVVDMHTNEGRKANKDNKLFRQEGSYVNNEYENTNQVYKLLYIEGKEDYPVKPWYMEFVDDKIIPETMIYESPRGQILTSRNKKYTYLPCNGFVYKGPWEEKYTQKIRNIYARRECILSFGMEENIIIYDFQRDNDGNIWFVTPSLTTTKCEDWIIEMKKGSIESEPIRIVDRNSLGYTQLSKLSQQEQEYWMIGKPNLILSYLFMALLGTGDMGPWNCICVGNGVCKIIDYDDDSGRTEMVDITDIFARKTAFKKGFLKSWFDKDKANITKFVDEMKNKIGDVESIIKKWNSSIDVQFNLQMILGLI